MEINAKLNGSYLKWLSSHQKGTISKQVGNLSLHGCDLCMSVVCVGVCKKYEIFHVPEGLCSEGIRVYNYRVVSMAAPRLHLLVILCKWVVWSVWSTGQSAFEVSRDWIAGKWAQFNRKKTSKQYSRQVWWIKREVLTGRRIKYPRSSSNTCIQD